MTAFKTWSAPEVVLLNSGQEAQTDPCVDFSKTAEFPERTEVSPIDGETVCVVDALIGPS